jgi:PAS domain S-box-containing protein
LGHQEEELLGQPASLLFSEEEDTAQSVLSQHALPVKRTVLRRLANEGSVSNVEKSLLTKSGDRIPVLLSGAVMRDDEDEIRGIVCLALDITDRKRAEAELLRARDELEVRVAERTAELKNSEARYQDLYDNAPDMFLSVDASSTRVVQCNKTLLTATGFRENEVVGRGMFDLVHPDCLPAMQRAFQTFVNTGKGKNVDLLLRRADGGTIDVSLNVSAVRDADGKITHSRSAMRDITEHKRAEELIRRQQEELNHAARLSTMGEMATGLAHEINQPLAAIAAYADGAGMRIRQGNAEIEGLAEIFDRIAADAHRAGEVIRRLRRFVKKRTTGRVASDINETVREVCRFVGAEASQQQTALHLELADALPRVPADAVQVQQVILNLIRNALDAMRDAGTMDRRVSIETRETETHGIEVIVQDTGPGISPGLKDQAFEQFFTSKDDGLGMGLAISQSIIEAHGGRIWFASPPGGGARVHITLPPNATEPDHA